MANSVGIGFIGTGFARRVQIPAFQACENARIVSIASGSLANAKATAEESGAEHFTDNWREIVERPDVDLVCITTPPNLHREMVLAALAAGKHLLAEKPMAMNVAEAEEMVAAATASGKLALIDHELRFLPGRQKAKALLHSGEIGKVRHAKYTFAAPHRGDQTQKWDWWSSKEAGGGALGAIGSHVIDSFHWFLETGIEAVDAQLQTHIKERPFSDVTRKVETDDQVNMLLRFRDGDITSDTTGSVSVSMIEGPEYVNRIEFVGDEGWMRVEHRGDLFIAKRSETEWTEVEVDYPPSIDGIFESGFPSGFMAFAPRIVDAIQKGESSIADAATFEDGLIVQQVLDAARESSDSGRRVTI
ncbi:MAG: Gfo/Idh/MocA family oxidoreductase [Acidobacteria bacterium]|nr:Gfo/Idh/MocA family oxidoreductase [Acidobacteriota bacterium]